MSRSPKKNDIKSHSEPPTSQSVNVATLKAELSRYLRLVQAGEQVVVLDHKMPVARIIPFERDLTVAFEVVHAKTSFADFFKMRGPKPEKKPLVDSLQILLKDRSSRS